MVRIDRLREDSEKRILRCSEGNSIWYQIWIDPGDMMRIEPLLEGRVGLRRYWIFFCRMNARDVFILWLFCVLCLGMPLTCVGKNFSVCVFKAFLGNALNTRR